jgi:hypothetical protein
MARGNDPTPSDYASLRGFVPQRRQEPVAEEQAEDHRVSVAAWLIGIGRVIARRVTAVPGSPVARLHARR